MNIQGHATWVTGDASGLGEAVAHELTRLGAKVVKSYAWTARCAWRRAEALPHPADFDVSL